MEHAGIARPKPLIVAHVLLLLAERSRHGYELAESLRTSEFEGLTTSTVYRELAKLEAEGLVQSFWQSSQARGPARHMYELTDAGRAELAACGDDVRDLIAHLSDYLTRCELVGAPAAPPPTPAHSAPAGQGLFRLWRGR